MEFIDECPNCGEDTFNTVDNECATCGYTYRDEWTDSEDDDLD
jgi:ribosomal protein L37E